MILKFYSPPGNKENELNDEDGDINDGDTDADKEFFKQLLHASMQESGIDIDIDEIDLDALDSIFEKIYVYQDSDSADNTRKSNYSSHSGKTSKRAQQ